MKNLLITLAVIFILSAVNIVAGDKEDVQSTVDNTINAFNKQDYKTYLSAFVNDNSAFSYVVSPLRHDSEGWKAFIESTGQLAYVNYYQQDEQIQVYNGNTAVVTAYFTFKWMEKGGQMNYQSGRASNVLVKQDGKWKTAHMHFSEFFK